MDPAETPPPMYESLHDCIIGGSSWHRPEAKARAGAKTEAAREQYPSHPQETVQSCQQKACPAWEGTSMGGNKDFSIGQARLGSVAVTNEP